jgi:glycosyltransferase involved in cell wall biosynthesis
MEYRPYYLGREWVRAGHSVRILAASYSHVRAKQPTVDDKAVTRRAMERIDGIEYVWYPAPSYQGNGVGRVRNIWAFIRQVWAGAPQIAAEFRPDVVIASSTYPLDIWVVRRLARRARAKLIYEVHDLWPLSPIELGGMSPHHPFIMLCQWAENTAYRDADAVVSMLPKVHEHMAAHGLDLRKLHIIPNGISLDEWQGEGQPLDGELAAHLRATHEKGHLVVGYAGSHGLPNALDNLLDAASMVKDTSIRFVLVGDGHERARLQTRVVQEGLANVRMFTPIPKAQIPTLLREFDVSYLGWLRCSLYRFGVGPNKLMDYMMAGCPILHSVEAGNDPVAEAGCGMTVLPESPMALADGLMKLAELGAEERHTMGLRGRQYVQAHHTYPVLAQQFLTTMRERM